MKAIGCIVLNWKCFEDTVTCVRSLQKQTYPSFEIIVVDNGSPDGSGERLRHELREVTVLLNDCNLGYAGGNNVGITEAIKRGAEYIFIFNPDTEAVSPDLLSAMTMVFEKAPECAILGPRLWDSRGPGGRVDCYKQSAYFRLLDKLLGTEARHFSVEDHQCAVCSVDRVVGCAMAIRSDFIMKHGGFEDEFFLYVEETELCMRAIKAGCCVGHLNDDHFSVFHRTKRRKEAPLAQYYRVRNMAHTIRKHSEGSKRFCAFALHAGTYSLLALRDFCCGDWASARYGIRGLTDGFRGVVGEGV